MYKPLTLLCFFLLSCSQEQAYTITVQDTWIRAVPLGASVMAGYLKINNATEQDCILTSAKSEHFNTVEFHRTIIKNDIARMRHYDELTIPAGQSLELKPGDFHLMLIGPQSALEIDDEVIITLYFKHGDESKELDIKMTVR